MSTIFCGSSPNFLPTTSASIPTSKFVADRTLLIDFMAWAEPRPPVSKIWPLMVSSAGRTFSMSSFAPPTIIAIEPSIARGTPPETGASTMRMPRSARAAPKAIVPIGAEDDISTNTDPPAMPSAIPPSPRTASATIFPFGKQVNTASASCPTAANPFAGRAVSCSPVKASTAA